MVVRVNNVFVEDHVAAADAGAAAESRQDAATVGMAELQVAAGGRSFSLQAGLQYSERHQNPVPYRRGLHPEFLGQSWFEKLNQIDESVSAARTVWRSWPSTS